MSIRDSEFLATLKQAYERLFIKEWPTGVGGILIGLMSVICFTWARPWGVVGGLRVWGDWFFHSVGLYATPPHSAWIDTNSIITMGLLWGSFAASLIARQFGFRVPPKLEIAKGIVGGTLLGIGAGLAGGCNVGGFYSAISALSLSGFAMMAGLLGGAWLGLKYLYWEMEHLPSGGGAQAKPKESRRDWSPIKPYLGWLVLALGIAANEVYRLRGYTIEGGILLCGMAFGFILVRSRFCFARAFREPFMTGDAKVTQAVAASLMISVLGFAILKWSGIRPEMSYVSSNFALGGMLGGFIFGFGMLMTGGCGSGTAWRAAEGQIKLIVALVVFTLSNSLTKAAINSSESIKALVGTRVFLPDYLGYRGTVLCIFLVLALWYLLAAWNEATDKFVVEM
ncbi:YeeE/YedE thiosulfate transporter family protein [Desulfovibrio ferrophilus]|uniref:YeeE/YedE n=1 Tax=Desulfovibrio ferrophilus TaxID=241368 RepID=A0A2Z6AZ38_9BACT|nr:YeeE/YedE thiosulfate transporter family protein [Desulfovibrio ferrophilus]BBD08478.1 YeeE/YedE [Desulfovibrio ferrophilus]